MHGRIGNNIVAKVVLLLEFLQVSGMARIDQEYSLSIYGFEFRKHLQYRRLCIVEYETVRHLCCSPRIPLLLRPNNKYCIVILSFKLKVMNFTIFTITATIVYTKTVLFITHRAE